MENPPICPAVVSQTRWQAPPPHWFKVNFDAALFENIKSIGVEVVVCSAEGYFLAGLCKKFKIPVEPSSAEAIAALVAVDFVTGSPFREIIFEGYAFSVINLIHSRSSSLGRFGL